MTFRVLDRGSQVLVTKVVPIRNVRHRFTFGFLKSDVPESDRPEAIARCKKAVSKAIRKELLRQCVKPPGKVVSE